MISREEAEKLAKELSELGLKSSELQRKINEYNRSECSHDRNYCVESQIDGYFFICSDCGFTSYELPEFIT